MNEFLEKIKNLDDSITFSGNPYVRKQIYEYCENNNMKFIKHRRKFRQYICAEHHCHLKFISWPKCCWQCDSYCPNSEDEGCGLHLEVMNRDKVITIYKNKPNMNNEVIVLR